MRGTIASDQVPAEEVERFGEVADSLLMGWGWRGVERERTVSGSSPQTLGSLLPFGFWG